MSINRVITLRTDSDDFVCKWIDRNIDICRSHTIIYARETVRLIAEIESVDIKKGKIVIWYKSGFYLVISPRG